MRILRLAILMFFAALGANAQNADELFRLGCNAYASADYAKAKSYFLESAKDAPASGTYYNIACCSQKLGEIGAAELYFMRSIYADPRFPEAKAALELLRKENSLSPLSDGLFNEFFDELSNSEWTWIAALFFWISIALYALPTLYGKRSAATIFLFAISVAAFIFSTMGIAYWREYTSTAVAISPDTPLRFSPAATAPVSAVLQPAQLAYIKKGDKNSFIYVEAANGKKGWADTKELVPVINR